MKSHDKGTHQGPARQRRPGHGRDRGGMVAHRAAQQERLFSRHLRRLVPVRDPGGSGAGVGQLRGRDPQAHHRLQRARGGPAGGIAGPGAALRDTGRGRRGGGLRGRRLSAPEKTPQLRVPAHPRTPAHAHQYLRRGDAGTERRDPGHPPVLSGTGLHPPPLPHHHALRLRGRRRNVPGLHPGPRAGAAHRLRRGGLLPGLLRQGGPANRFRTARGRNRRPGPLQRLHLRADVPLGELQHQPAPGGVLDGGAGDGLLRHPGEPWIWPRPSSRT